MRRTEIHLDRLDGVIEANIRRLAPRSLAEKGHRTRRKTESASVGPSVAPFELDNLTGGGKDGLDGREEKRGLFGYIESQMGRSRERREENEQSLSDKLLDAQQTDSSAPLLTVNELVYPLLARLKSREKDFKSILKSLVAHSSSGRRSGETIFPVYKTTEDKERGWQSLLRFRMGRMDYLFLSEGARVFDEAEEMVSKKALCELEEKGVLFLFGKDAMEGRRKVCDLCGIEIPMRSFKHHRGLCKTHIERQKIAFSLYKEAKSKF